MGDDAQGLSSTAAWSATDGARRIGLVGCVKAKRDRPSLARDLYVSTLFEGRRDYVERSCSEWWILSAAHGLVDPATVLAPYDVTLKTMSPADRRAWAARVVAEIDRRVGITPGDVVELHAGREYCEFGVAEALQARGARIERPTAGLGIGQQLAFYAAARSEARPVSSDAEAVDAERRSAPDRRGDDLARLYDLLRLTADRTGGPRRLADCSASSGWPERGVYFFFEPGELRAANPDLRVVRVGTHALVPSKSTLWSRLSSHQGNRGGSMPGGGNHRGSIFRLHVGAALLAAGDWDDTIGATWGIGSTSSRAVREAEYPLERAVSAHIGAMPLLWVGIDDPAGPDSDRGVVERGAIALLSGARVPSPDSPSPSWLGHHAQRPAIRGSGLWNVNHVDERYDPAFLDVLERWICS